MSTAAAFLTDRRFRRAEHLRTLGLVRDRERRMFAQDLGFHADGVADGVPIAGGEACHRLLVHGVELRLQLLHAVAKRAFHA